MAVTSPPRLISCDEAGYTGPNLSNLDQPYFAYAAHDLTVEEATTLIADIRRRHPIQAPELKASSLRRRDNWPVIAEQVLDALEGRLLVTVFDKQLALAGKAYEYLIEPVVEDNSALFYRHNLQRLVANAVHRTIVRANDTAETVGAELEKFMRSFDPADAPHLFDAAPDLPTEAAVLRQLLRIARGYRERIADRTGHLREEGKWVLDLTFTALSSLLQGGFGLRHERVEVLCDESKPLLAMAPFFESWVGRTEKVRLHAGDRIIEVRLNLAQPLTFGRSTDHPTLQIADLAAGIAAAVHRTPNDPALASVIPRVTRHLDPNHILPRDDVIDPANPLVRANLVVLQHLAGRAELHQDPLEGMAEVYARALKRAMHPAGRLKIQRRERRKQ
ncbi:DUF3800 domain-containing protein [Microvirga sp. 3-52]|uniref:DUF3800 domain-containing protein n=1 Tax=Microvirga sp. 3-52 TaxID=2792425 RepID=UPI001AC44451|nr:DUF3800 domain-containing protein [Microvirga sp. 3-52]MBO1905296.1 DUF3800 domain-containing protein [Microvirga sp. 3-52]MBS7452615.1 DUF3800 domain-containing protein [Microvirga sp. 3-52]